MGKTRATRVRRLSSWLIRSRALVVRRRFWCATGKAKTVRPWGMFSSIHEARTYFKGTSENPVLHDSIFRWGLLGTALDGVGGRMRTARRATRDVDLIRY